MYFWLNYSGKNNHIERILVIGQDISLLFRKASEFIESDKLHLFLFSESTLIDYNK